jgi:glycosyltransferase involved in cell wall biosynthesis
MCPAHNDTRQGNDNFDVALISAAAPPQVNGAAVALANLARELTRMGVRTTLHVPDTAKRLDVEECMIWRYRSVELPLYPGYRYPISLTPEYHAPARFSVAHALTHGPWEMMLLRRMRANGAATILSMQTDYSAFLSLLSRKEFLRKFLSNAQHRYERSLCTKVDAVHVLNSSRIASCGARAFVLPFGVDPAAIELARAHKQRPPTIIDGQVSICFVGRLSIEKAPERLLDLLDWFPAAVVFVFGGGPQENRLRRAAARRGHSARLLLYGELRQQEALARLAGMDALVLPSKAEEFGLVILEAATLGVPVLTIGTLPGPREIASRLPRNVAVVSRWERSEVISKLNELLRTRPSPVDPYSVSWSSPAHALCDRYRKLLSMKASAPLG